MKYAILGAGNVGTAISRAVTAAGHDTIVADVDEEALSRLSNQIVGVQTTTDGAMAAAWADVVVLAVPYPVAEQLFADFAEELDDTVVIDATNPLANDLSGLVTDGGPAGAQRLQAAAPRARVVKAFNTVFAGNQSVGEVDGVQLDGFVASDHPDAKALVVELLEATGFRPVDVGGLSAARYLEGLAFLNIALNATNGLPWQSGWKLVGPVA